MLTIGWKQFLLILVIGFLLFGNFPKQYENLKAFLKSSKIQEDFNFIKKENKSKEEKDNSSEIQKEDIKEIKKKLFNRILQEKPSLTLREP